MVEGIDYLYYLARIYLFYLSVLWFEIKNNLNMNNVKYRNIF